MAEDYLIGKDIAELNQRIVTLEYQVNKIITELSSYKTKDGSSRA